MAHDRAARCAGACDATSRSHTSCPRRLDDTVVPGLVSTTAYIDGSKKTAIEITELTLDHLRESGRKVAPPLIEREMALRVSVRAIPERTPDGRWQVPFRI